MVHFTAACAPDSLITLATLPVITRVCFVISFVERLDRSCPPKSKRALRVLDASFVLRLRAGGTAQIFREGSFMRQIAW